MLKMWLLLLILLLSAKDSYIKLYAISCVLSQQILQVAMRKILNKQEE